MAYQERKIRAVFQQGAQLVEITHIAGAVLNAYNPVNLCRRPYRLWLENRLGEAGHIVQEQRQRQLRKAFESLRFLQTVTETPGFGQVGFLDMFETWRETPAHFVRIERLELERPRAGGTEIVEVYEVH